MTTKFDPTKPVRTRDGCAARIICTDAKGDYPIIALVANENNDEEFTYFYADNGKHYLAYMDLINVPERKTRFLNMGSAFSNVNPAARHYRDWPVLEVTFEGDTVVETKMHPALEPS